MVHWSGNSWGSLDPTTRISHAAYYHPQQGPSATSMPRSVQLAPVRPQVLHFMDPQQGPVIKPPPISFREMGGEPTGRSTDRSVQRASSQGSLRGPVADNGARARSR